MYSAYLDHKMRNMQAVAWSTGCQWFWLPSALLR